MKYISLNVDPHENNFKKLCFGENDDDNLGSATRGFIYQTLTWLHHALVRSNALAGLSLLYESPLWGVA